MQEAIVAVLAAEAQAARLRFHSHFAERLLEREMPQTHDIVDLHCDDDPQAIEPYANDYPKPSCLIWGIIQGRVGHVLVTSPPNPLVIIAYWPDLRPGDWTENFTRRAPYGV